MSDQSHLAEPVMNATPLIDVLLVLIVILIITLPIATHAVKLNLPQAPGATPPPTIALDIDFDGRIFWNGEHVVSVEALSPRLRTVADDLAPPLISVRPDKRAPYERVAQVLAAAQRAQVRTLRIVPVP